jgi:hypothetical protein
LKAKDAKKFKRLKSLILASWNASADAGKTGKKPPRMSVLGLPSVKSAAETAQMINVSYSAVIILVLFLLGFSFDGVFANVGLFGLLVVSAFVWSKLGRPFSPLPITLSSLSSPLILYARAQDDRRALHSFMLLCAMRGAFICFRLFPASRRSVVFVF